MRQNISSYEELWRSRRVLSITPSEISIILHIIRKLNSITVLLFVQNNSQLKNEAKTCLPPSIHRCSVHLRQCLFRFVQLHKYSPNSRCRPSSCLLAVLALFLAIFFAQFLLLKRVKCPPFFQVHNQNNSTSSPGLLG